MYYICRHTINSKKKTTLPQNQGSRTKDIVVVTAQVLLPCQNLAPTLPIMQSNDHQFGLRLGCAMLVEANVAMSSGYAMPS